MAFGLGFSMLPPSGFSTVFSTEFLVGIIPSRRHPSVINVYLEPLKLAMYFKYAHTPHKPGAT